MVERIQIRYGDGTPFFFVRSCIWLRFVHALLSHSPLQISLSPPDRLVSHNHATYLQPQPQTQTPTPTLPKKIILLDHFVAKLVSLIIPAPMASKLCDSCKSATATLYCRPDSAFLCPPCDSKVHAANKLASRHPRVSLCEVCEQAPAHVTCKADAASLCLACDHDIHSANPLASRHERLPVVPFYHSLAAVKSPVNFLDEGNRFFSDADADADVDVSTEEAEAASWLLPTPSNPTKADLNSSQYLYPEMETVPYVDLDYGVVDPKSEQKSSATADGVVPVQIKGAPNEHYFEPFAYGGYKYSTQSQSHSQMSHSMSSSSMEVGVVPDGNAMSEISNCQVAAAVEGGNQSVTVVAQFSAADREARVLRYREKRKNRKFEKTIRYASRKAYAETRPRIKGRFAKRSEVVDPLNGYGVVPSC